MASFLHELIQFAHSDFFFHFFGTVLQTTVSNYIANLIDAYVFLDICRPKLISLKKFLDMTRMKKKSSKQTIHFGTTYS